MIPVEFPGDLWHPKTRVPGLSCDVVCVILRLAVLVGLRLVTDGQTDGHRAMASTEDVEHRALKIHLYFSIENGQPMKQALCQLYRFRAVD